MRYFFNSVFPLEKDMCIIMHCKLHYNFLGNSNNLTPKKLFLRGLTLKIRSCAILITRRVWLILSHSYSCYFSAIPLQTRNNVNALYFCTRKNLDQVWVWISIYTSNNYTYTLISRRNIIKTIILPLLY